MQVERFQKMSLGLPCLKLNGPKSNTAVGLFRTLLLFGVLSLAGCLATPQYIGAYSFDAKPDPSVKLVKSLAERTRGSVEWIDDHDYARQAMIKPTLGNPKKDAPIIVYTYRPNEGSIVVRKYGPEETEDTKALRSVIEKSLADAGIADWKYRTSKWSFAR